MDIGNRSALYFVFLRYRNSEAYRETVGRLTRRVVVGDAVAQVRRAWHRVRWRAVFGSFHAFPHRDGPATQPRWHWFGEFGCWQFLDAEICFGVASEEQQCVLPDTCFTSLEEDFGGDLWACFLLATPVNLIYVQGRRRIYCSRRCLRWHCIFSVFRMKTRATKQGLLRRTPGSTAMRKKAPFGSTSDRIPVRRPST